MAQSFNYPYHTPSVSHEEDKTPRPQDYAHDLLGIAPMSVILPISGRIKKKWSRDNISMLIRLEEDVSLTASKVKTSKTIRPVLLPLVREI
jgi:hypothetical protein